jgi:hypothetical protein
MPGFEIANYLFNLKLRLCDLYVDINYFIYIIVDNVLKLETNHKEIIDNTTKILHKKNKMLVKIKLDQPFVQ